MKSSRVCLGLLVSECVLVIVSWLLSAARIEGVRSMLSSEGIRWFFGGFSHIISNQLLAWLLLALIAGGSLQQSGVLQHFSFKSEVPFRNRLALRVASAFLVLYVLVISMLTLMPHAILLSFSGHLFPSAFSRGLVPIICFGVTLFSVVYGIISGNKQKGEDVIDILSYGLRQGSYLIIIYIFAIQFYASLRFVFG
jgi:aminobenzoyl-glutamate transport protein